MGNKGEDNRMVDIRIVGDSRIDGYYFVVFWLALNN